MSSTERHIRIDEGIAKGPRRNPAPPRERVPACAGKLGPDFNPMAVLDQYLQGRLISEIADELGVHHNALYYHLVKPENKEQWKAAQVAVALAEKEEAIQNQKVARDALDLGRAREVRNGRQWDLERLDASTFGQKQEVTHKHDPIVILEGELTDTARSLIDKMRGKQVIDVTPESHQADATHCIDGDDNA